MGRYRQAADLAMALDAPEALAQAALGYDEPRWRCNLDEPYANTLLERALARIGSGDSVLRVYLMAHLAHGSQDSMPAEKRTALLDESVAMARRLDDPRALIESLQLHLSVDRTPDRIGWRVRTLDEMLRLAQRLDDKQLTLDVLAFRIYDLVALGDAASWSRDLDAHQHVADEIREPFYTYCARAMIVARAINSGNFQEAERLAGEAHAIGQQLGVDNADGVLGVQMFTIRREQGRLREVAPFVQHFVVERGAGAAWRPGLAVIYADLEQRSDAETAFEQLAADGFQSVPRDSLWQASLCYLVDVCDYLGDAERAATLYDMLLPYADLTVMLGNATVCLGATSRFLGQLASTMARWQDAEAHFEHALALNGRMEAVPWIAHTRFQYSRELMRRGRREDSARAVQLLDEAITVARQHGMYGLLSRIKDGAVAI
jgi:tetratricopeptide (TPR) repeat protein